MKVLITGGAGLVGSHTAEYYAKKGDEVIVLDNLMRSSLFGYNKDSVEFNWNYLAQFDNIKRIKGDVREEQDIMKALGDGVDAVIHTAGQPGVPLSMKIPKEDFSINAYGTLNVLECVRKVCPKAAFIYCSCYDEKTSAITSEGIKSFAELEKGDKVLSINPTTGKIEEKEVEEVIIQDFEGEMIDFKGKRMDLRVTPNHRMYMQIPKGNGIIVESAENILKKKPASLKFPIGKFTGNFRNTIKLGEKNIDFNDFLYLMGIYIGDGSCQSQTKYIKLKTGYRREEYLKRCRDFKGRFVSHPSPKNCFSTTTSHVIFFHIPEKDKSRKTVEKVLERCNIKYHSAKSKIAGNWGIFFSSKKLYSLFSQCGTKAHLKHIPRWVFKYDSSHSRYLMLGLFDSDGYKKRFYTSSRYLLRDMIELGVKLGYNVTFSKRPKPKKSLEIKGRTIFKRHEAYFVNFSTTPVGLYPRRNIKKSKYKGKIWCVCVKDNDNLLVERNGKTLFCGNTNKIYGENVDTITLEEKETRYVYKSKKGISEELGVDLTGHTPYGASKYTGDIYVQEYGHMYGMKTAVFRMSCIYGTRQFGFEDQGWVAWFVIANLTGQDIVIYGDGKQVRDLLYADDLVEAYDKFINNGMKHDVFNIGGGPRNTTSLLEFISLVEQKTGIKFRKIEYKSWRPSDQKVYISDISKVSKALSWKPGITVEKGLEKLIEWVGANNKFFI